MAPKKQTAFRLDQKLVARIDAFAERLAAETPSMKVTRADAVRVLLVRALDTEVPDTLLEPTGRAVGLRNKS